MGKLRKLPTNGQFSTICRKIENDEYFSFVRYTHGLWDKMHSFEVPYNIKNIKNPRQLELAAKLYCAPRQRGGWVMTEDVMRQCFHHLSHLDDYSSNIFTGISSVGSPNAEIKEVLLEKEKIHSPIFDKFIHGNVPIYDGLLWKRAILEQRFFNFIDKIRDKHVILIAPEEIKDKRNKEYFMSNLGVRLNIPNFTHIDIHPKQASAQYKELLHKISYLNSTIKEDKVFLFKAGPLGVAIITRLHNDSNNTYMFDMGNSLDIFAPGISRNWKSKNSKIINKTYNYINNIKK